MSYLFLNLPTGEAIFFANLILCAREWDKIKTSNPFHVLTELTESEVIMTVEQLSVFIENKPGKLLEALEALADAKIDLRALSLADTADFGILRVIVDKPEHTLKVLSEAGFLVKSSEVLAVIIGDKPGGLAAVVRILSEVGVNIEYTYAFVAHSKDNAYVILRVDDNDTAIKILTTSGISLLNAKEMYSM